MYRPTVRYDDIFREYVDSLFHATNLDCNQILRAAFFAAAHSEKFQNLLQPHQKKDVPLPSPLSIVGTRSELLLVGATAAIKTIG